jgi:hypothetical protein
MCSAVQCSAVQCSAVQCSAVQCSAVVGPRTGRPLVIIAPFYEAPFNSTVLHFTSYTAFHWLHCISLATLHFTAYTVFHWPTLHFTGIHCTTVHYPIQWREVRAGNININCSPHSHSWRTVKCREVQYCTVQCSAVQYSKVQGSSVQ